MGGKKSLAEISDARDAVFLVMEGKRRADYSVMSQKKKH